MNTSEIVQQTRTLVAPLVQQPGSLLVILHELQDSFGYVPTESVPVISQMLNLSRAEVHGVISFYHGFYSEPQGEKTLQICRAESCQAMGSKALEATAKEVLGVDFHETTPDGRLSLEPVYCLGLCANSPAIMLGDTLHSQMNPTALRNLLEQES